MDIAGFIRDMLPSFGKKDVEEKLRMISTKVAKVLRPTLELFAETLNEASFKSAYAKAFMVDFLKFVPNNLRNVKSPYMRVLGVVSTNIDRLVDLLEDYVSKNMGSEIHIEGITYQKASVLRVIEVLDFVVDYSSRNLSLLTASETNIEAFERPDGQATSPADQRWLIANRAAYFQALDMLFTDPKALLKQIHDIPEILIGDVEIQSVPALANGAGDPLSLGAIPIVSHVFKWVGIRKANYDADRFERMMKEKQIIELRLEALRSRRGGEQSAQTESIIEGYESELILIRQRVAEAEARNK